MIWANLILILKDALYLAVIAFLSYLFYKERKNLLKMIRARNLQEYEYYDKMYKKDIKEAEKIRDEAREERSIDEEIKAELDIEYKKEKEFLKQNEEEWNPDEVDLEKLREKINE